jgi:protein-disulfide isomerase
MQPGSRPGFNTFAIRSTAVIAIPFILLIALIAANAQAPVKLPPNCVCGKLDAPVRLEIFSDFQCPACRAFYMETISQVRKYYAPAGKVCVIYHEFPLKMHAYGRKAALYSLAAQRIGKKQWLAVLEALYEKQARWSLDGNIASALSGVISAEDLSRINKIMQDPSIDKALTREIALGEKKGVTGTPSIFVTAMKREQPKAPYASYVVWKDYIDSIVK